MIGQHASLLPSDPLLLQQHAQIPVSISTSQGVTNLAIPASAMHLDMSQAQHQPSAISAQQHHQDNGHMNHNQMQNNHRTHHSQTNMVQVQVQDNLVSVIEDSKDHTKDLIASQLAQAQIQLADGQQLNQQTLTVQQLQHLQVQQVLDNVVRMENAVENNHNQPNEQVSSKKGETDYFFGGCCI